MIQGTKAQIEAVQAIEDKSNRLPLRGVATDAIAARAMAADPDLGWTLHVHGITEDKDTACMDATVELKAAVAKAKAKPDKDRTADEKALAAVSVGVKPEPKPEAPAEPVEERIR